MLHNTADCEADRQRFIQRVISSETVWALEGEAGFAWCESNEDEDRNIIVFWSDRAYAERARKALFPEYEPVEITLFNFLFRWLGGMANDGVFAGANWTGDLAGIETNPEELQDWIMEEMPESMRERYFDQLEKGLAEQKDSREK